MLCKDGALAAKWTKPETYKLILDVFKFRFYVLIYFEPGSLLFFWHVSKFNYLTIWILANTQIGLKEGNVLFQSSFWAESHKTFAFCNFIKIYKWQAARGNNHFRDMVQKLGFACFVTVSNMNYHNHRYILMTTYKKRVER